MNNCAYDEAKIYRKTSGRALRQKRRSSPHGGAARQTGTHLHLQKHTDNVAWDGVGRRTSNAGRAGVFSTSGWREGRASIRGSKESPRKHTFPHLQTCWSCGSTHTNTHTLRRALLWHRVAAGLSGGWRMSSGLRKVGGASTFPSASHQVASPSPATTQRL